MKHLRKINESNKEWSYEEADQLFGEIDNEGFGYWILEYGYDGKDEELKKLCKEAKISMNKLKKYIEHIFKKVGIDEGI